MPMLHRSLIPDQYSPLIVAHRGASRYAPENSVAAVELAIAHGADIVEVDIRRTADGILVAHHDPAIDGIPVGRLQYNAMRTAVPELATLDELLQVTAGHVLLDLELKEAGYEDDVLRLVEGCFPLDDLLMTSFSPQAILRVKTLAPSVLTGWLVEEPRPADVLGSFSHTHADWLLVKTACLDTQLIIDIWAHEVPLVIWTVNLWSEIAALLDLPGLAAIITDLPDVAAALRNRHMARMLSGAIPLTPYSCERPAGRIVEISSSVNKGR